MNLTVIEDWIEEIGIPPGIQMHFAPVRDLLKWLQVVFNARQDVLLLY